MSREKSQGQALGSSSARGASRPMRHALTVLALTLGVMAAGAQAQIRYETPISDVNAKNWSTSTSKISCVLSSNIEGYGRADFTLLSGAQRRLSLELFPKVAVNTQTTMRVLTVPAEWRPQGDEAEIGSLQVYKGFNPFIGDSVSWAVLLELSHGKRVMMPYLASTNLGVNQMLVPTLSPIGFSPAYQEFLDCSAQLLPYGYRDVSLVAIMFYDKENRMTPSSDERLFQQINYVKLDPSINKIIISAFGSGNNDNLDNLDLAKSRADTLVKILTDNGIAKELIEAHTYGDEQLATTGYTISERQQSSKAIIELQRDPFRVDSRLEVEMPDIGVPGAVY